MTLSRDDLLGMIAIVGYSLLLVFSIYKLADTMKRPIDFIANILLLIGLTALIVYHVRKLREMKDEKNDISQKNVRLIAHSTLTTFLLFTLSPLSAASFRFYDWFALAGHSTLFVSVWTGMTQLFGVGMLALYFLFATGRKFNQTGMEILQLFGRALLSVFFAIVFVTSVLKI
jgi:hypothetical protein